MKTTRMIRNSCFALVMALLCFAPGAIAQKVQMSPTNVSALTGYSAVLMHSPFTEDRKKKKKVAMPEGGAAALYLVLAGAACFGAMFIYTRRKVSTEKAS